MSKDYIFVTKNDGSSEKMEVFATFKLEETGKNCIIYKSINDFDNKYYAASYEMDSDYSNLDVNFTDKEKEQINKIFEVLNYGGDINA